MTSLFIALLLYWCFTSFNRLKNRNPDGRSCLRGIDVNQVADFEEENGVLSSLSGKRSEREPIGDENEAERTSCSHGSDDEDGNDNDLSRKKLRLTKEQSLLLANTFKEHNILNPKQKQALAKQLNLRPRQVEVWFQNRRAREEDWRNQYRKPHSALKYVELTIKQGLSENSESF